MTNKQPRSDHPAITSPTGEEVIRAAVWRGPGQLEMESRPVPDCPPGSVLLRPDLVGLCGTDLTIVSGRHGRAAAPLVLGHEFTATVIISAEPGIDVGSAVVVQPTLPCGGCWPCLHNLSHTCRRLGLIGIDIDGALAELIAVPATSILVLPADTPPEQAVLAEPLAVAVHAVDQANLQVWQTVLIIGAGPIGVLTGLVAAGRGARVLVSEPHDGRREFAASIGFEPLDPGAPMVDQVVEYTDGALCDVLFDCAAYPPLAVELSAAVREHGTIVLVALYSQPTPIDLHAVSFGEQHLVGSRVYTRADLQTAVDLIGTDSLHLGRLPVAVFPLTDVEGAVTAARQGTALKIMVAPQQSDH